MQMAKPKARYHKGSILVPTECAALSLLLFSAFDTFLLTPNLMIHLLTMRPLFAGLLSVLVFIHSHSVESFRSSVAFPLFRRVNDTVTRRESKSLGARELLPSHKRHIPTQWMQVSRSGVAYSAKLFYIHSRELLPSPKRRVSTLWMQVSRGGAVNSPKLSQWIFPALSSALSYASYNIFIKLGSSSISPLLGGVILQTIAALLGTCLLGVSNDKLAYDKKGIMWSALAGIAVGAAELLSFQVSAMGVEASRSTPVMIGGSVVFGSFLGFALLKERMTIKGWFGVFLVVVGIACVATDPGANMAGH